MAAYVNRHELFDGGQDVSAIVNILEDAPNRLRIRMYLLLAEVYRTTDDPELRGAHYASAAEVPIRAQLRFERAQLFLQGIGQKESDAAIHHVPQMKQRH